jgi:hypothetical protein
VSAPLNSGSESTTQPATRPDLRDPKVIEEFRHEAKLMAQHPENDAIDDWLESVIDWESWK